MTRMIGYWGNSILPAWSMNMVIIATNLSRFVSLFRSTFCEANGHGMLRSRLLVAMVDDSSFPAEVCRALEDV